MFNELTIDRCSGKPVSMQIAQFVKGKIASSDLAPGSKFPTTQEFVKQIGVGPHTVRQAMKHLEKEGLVKSTPRLGTVVCESAFTIVHNDGQQISTSSQSGRIRKIGVVGLIQNVEGGKVRYCVETAEGIMQECERLGITAAVLPASFNDLDGPQMLDELVRLECEGVVWVGNLPCDNDALEYIRRRGIKIIFRRRSQRNDGWPCIQADYENAGFRTGNYFYDCNVRELIVFSHFDFSSSYKGCEINSYPIAIRQGIVRAYEQLHIKPSIEVYVNTQENKETSRNIYNVLKSCNRQKGVVFTNGYQLLDYFIHTGLPGYDLLKNFKTVAISNLTINYQLRPFVSDLDLMVLVDNFKETGTLLVGSLLGILDGYFDSATTTLVNVDFAEFEDSFRLQNEKTGR